MARVADWLLSGNHHNAAKFTRVDLGYQGVTNCCQKVGGPIAKLAGWLFVGKPPLLCLITS